MKSPYARVFAFVAVSGVTGLPPASAEPGSAAVGQGTSELPEESRNETPPAPAVAAPESEAALLPNTLFLELGGPAVLYSVNYERVVGDRLGLRVGFSHAETSGGPVSVSGPWTAVPLSLNLLALRRGAHVFELGLGALVTSNGSGTFAPIGYRYHPTTNGYAHFRVGADLFSGPNGIFPWGHVSFGVAF